MVKVGSYWVSEKTTTKDMYKTNNDLLLSLVFAITYILKRLIQPSSFKIRPSWDFYLKIIYFPLKVSIDHREKLSRKLTQCTKVYHENIKQIKNKMNASSGKMWAGRRPCDVSRNEEMEGDFIKRLSWQLTTENTAMSLCPTSPVNDGGISRLSSWWRPYST